MRILSAQRAFPIVLVMTLAIALLPGKALRWARMPAEIVGLVLTPFTLVGNEVGAWVRPPPPALEGVAISAESLQHFQEQMVEFERLYLAEQARADELERQLEQLQNAPADLPRHPVRLLLARIALRAPSDPLGVVTINRGSRDGVAAGTIAVHDHVHLVGQVKDVSHVQSSLVPLGNPETGILNGTVIAQDRADTAVSLANAPRLQLEPKGDGTFSAEPDKSYIINPGDEVVLIDDDWPRSAQGMKIGTVESVTPNARKPLRNTVVVRPTYHVSQVRMVVLRIEADEDSILAGVSDDHRGAAGGATP